MYVGKIAQWSLSWCLNKKREEEYSQCRNVMFSFFLLKLRFCERDSECHLVFYLVHRDCPLLTFDCFFF